MTAKDRKQKKRKQEAKLRQHVEKGAAEVKEALNISSNADDDNARLLQAMSNADSQQLSSDRFLSARFGHANGSHTGASRSHYDEEEEGNGADGKAIDDARMNRLGENEQQNAASSGQQATTKDNTVSQQPKRKKFRQEEMKLVMERALGPRGVSLLPHVDAHTGNAPEPFVCAQIASNKNYVPIPRHWSKVSAYLSEQNDRPESNIIPDEIKATGVEYVRNGNNKQPNIAGFARAFLNGSPLMVKTHGVRLLEKGAAYEGARWKPSITVTPGVISEKLRLALGMQNDKVPPPWLHAMQRVKVLPPSYPHAKFPGLNAPIPEGGQWGFAKGQWGEPVRKSDSTFLYPAVQSLGHAAAAAAVEASQATLPPPYGTVPPRRRVGANESTPSTETGPRHIPTIVNEDAKKAPIIQPMTFVPSTANQPIGRPQGLLPVLQMGEYLRDLTADDNDDDLVNVSQRLVARGTTGTQPMASYSVNLTPNLGNL